MFGLTEIQAEKQAVRVDKFNKTLQEKGLDPTGREAFLLRRSVGLGGSDMGVIMGVNPYKTPYQLWLEKTGRTPIEDKSGSFAIRLGVGSEAVIADWYAYKTGSIVESYPAYTLPEIPYLISNYDRVVWDKGHSEMLGGLEVKTCAQNVDVFTDGVVRRKWGKGNTYAPDGSLLEIDNQIDPAYLPQVQFYLYTSGLPWWDVAAMIGGMQPKFYRIFPDAEYQKKMILRAAEFWAHVLDDEPVAMTYNDARELPTEPAAQPATAPAELVALCAEYKTAQAAEKAAEAKVNELKDKIAAFMGTTEKFVTEKDGKQKTLVTFKGSKSRRFDAKALEIEKPEIYQNYLKEVNMARALRVY